MRAAWLSVLVLLSAGLADRGMPARAMPSHEAQIRGVSAPGSPFAPSSPEQTPRPLALCVLETIDAHVASAAAAAHTFTFATGGVGPGEAHERRIERPPIPPRSFPS